MLPKAVAPVAAALLYSEAVGEIEKEGNRRAINRIPLLIT
jgi:hypothetical protein